MIQRIVTSGYKVSAVGSWNGAKLAKETERAQRAEKEGAGDGANALHNGARQDWFKTI